ncbi:membrane protein [Cupriavidus sp. amp6]|uniref:COG4648 family protein n=1 Tax=Cupriavidus sp. amp6 TaxID=388051 RepID=UPI000403EA53|nr:membrane protein [Cupriavidus sp. amp6]
MAWRNWALGALTLCYPVAVYVGLQYWPPRTVALLLVALMLLRLAAVRHAGWRPLALIAGAIALVVLASGEAMPLKLYPALVNAVLLVVFGWSLWRPPSVVERLARLREPDLPQMGVAYTRKVTAAWCLFFCGNGAIALATACFASDRVWALYNGAIAYVLIGTMFAGEWLVRRHVMTGSRHD